MDAKEKILGLLAGGPREAEQLGRKTGLRGQGLASLLMKLEKEQVIVWEQGAWRLGESPELRGGSQVEQPDR